MGKHRRGGTIDIASTYPVKDQTVLSEGLQFPPILPDQADMVLEQPFQHRFAHRDEDRIAGDGSDPAVEGDVGAQKSIDVIPRGGLTLDPVLKRLQVGGVARAAARRAMPTSKKSRASLRSSSVFGEWERMCRAVPAIWSRIVRALAQPPARSRRA